MMDRQVTDQPRAASAESVPPSRALVVVESPCPKVAGHDRPQASFLAQLIACERRLPAYRQARKAAPEAAANAYGRTAAPLHARLNCLV